MKKHKSDNTEMILYSYTIGFVYILFWEVFVSGQLLEAIKFCNQVIKIFENFNESILKKCLPLFLLKHLFETYGYIFFYSFVGYFGLNVVLTLVKQFGALVAVTVTSFR